MIIMIQNTSTILGQYMFSEMLGPIMDKMMNHY